MTNYISVGDKTSTAMSRFYDCLQSLLNPVFYEPNMCSFDIVEDFPVNIIAQRFYRQINMKKSWINLVEIPKAQKYDYWNSSTTWRSDTINYFDNLIADSKIISTLIYHGCLGNKDLINPHMIKGLITICSFQFQSFISVKSNSSINFILTIYPEIVNDDSLVIQTKLVYHLYFILSMIQLIETNRYTHKNQLETRLLAELFMGRFVFENATELVGIEIFSKLAQNYIDSDLEVEDFNIYHNY